MFREIRAQIDVKKGRDAAHRPHKLGTHLTHPCGTVFRQFRSRRKAGTGRRYSDSGVFPTLPEPSPRPLERIER
jgi:hypothetical protein